MGHTRLLSFASVVIAVGLLFMPLTIGTRVLLEDGQNVISIVTKNRWSIRNWPKRIESINPVATTALISQTLSRQMPDGANKKTLTPPPNILPPDQTGFATSPTALQTNEQLIRSGRPS